MAKPTRTWSIVVTSNGVAAAPVRLPRGQTLVGRGETAAVRVDDPGVSWEHLALFVDPADAVRAENRSSLGTRLNDQPLTARQGLRPNDRLRLSPAVELRLVASGAGGPSNTLLAGGVLAALAALAVAIVAGNRADDPPPPNFQAAYVALDGWLDAQVNAGRLPRQPQTLIRNAWRFEQGNDPATATRLWSLAGLSLGGLKWDDAAEPWGVLAARHRTALTDLLADPKLAIDDHTGPAALVQLVHASAKFDREQVKESE